MTVEIYTDGSCSGNPGPGGYAYAIIRRNEAGMSPGFYSQAFGQTTNGEMELRAVISALKDVPKTENVKLYTDSIYVVQGITNWINKWRVAGWVKSDGRTPVKHSELWRELDAEVVGRNIEWIWVRGHDGNQYNELVDKMAVNAARHAAAALGRGDEQIQNNASIARQSKSTV